MKNKQYYIDIAKRRWNNAMDMASEKLKNEGYEKDKDAEGMMTDSATGKSIAISDVATEIYEVTMNVDETVGHYLWLHGERALKDWEENTSGLKLSKQDKKVDEILHEIMK